MKTSPCCEKCLPWGAIACIFDGDCPCHTEGKLEQCVCGEPWANGYVHRKDAPCYVEMKLARNSPPQESAVEKHKCKCGRMSDSANFAYHVCPATPPVEEVVTLAEKGTLLAQFQKVRTDAISEMLEGKFPNGIYPTSKFFAQLDNCVSALLSQARREEREAIAEKVANEKLKYNKLPTSAVNVGKMQVLADILSFLST